MDRKTFIKSAMGLIGLTAVVPAVLLAKPVDSAKDYHIRWAKKCYRDYTRRHPLTYKECYHNSITKEILETWQETGTLPFKVKNKQAMKELIEWQNRGYKN